MKNNKSAKSVEQFSGMPLFLINSIILLISSITAVHAELKGSCPSGYTLNLTSSTGYVYCLKKTTQSYKSYASYTPCTSPGVYKTTDEKSDGRDQCNTYGVISPALPCVGINIHLQVKQGAKDACYYNKTRTINTYADVILTN